MFKHEFLPRTELESETIEGQGRYYTTPVGILPSVTTVLGRELDQSWLEEWKARVGAAEVEQVRNQAAGRGTRVHAILDKYLNNDPNYIKGAMPSNVFTFRSGQKILDQNVTKVYGIEYPLYSKRLKTAGRSDLICQWDSVNTIVDYKTAKKAKKEADILGYMLQSACYSIMAEDLLNIRISQFVVMIFVDFEKPQLFIRKVNEFRDQVETIFGK